MRIPDQPLRFQNKDEWRAWLQANHAAQKEAWLVILKKSAAGSGIYYEEAVEEALCFGWIDGSMKSVDAGFYILRFSPRKGGSTWAASNLERVERLIAQGKMTEAGLEKVREARENGEWDAALRREQAADLPGDLREALQKNPAAQSGYENLPASQRKMILYWIEKAKAGKTRLKRIQELVEIVAKRGRPDGQIK